MQLTDLEPQSAQLYLVHPITKERITDDNDVEVYLEVVGRDSEQYLDSQKDFLKLIESRGKDALKDMSTEEVQNKSKDQLAGHVVGWDKKFNPFFAGFDTRKGGGTYSKALIKKIVHSPKYGWLMHQIDDFVAEREHFFVNS